MECLVCGRKLSDPQSRERGYGPVCYRRVFGGSRARKGSRSSAGWMQNYGVPRQITMDEYLQSIAAK